MAGMLTVPPLLAQWAPSVSLQPLTPPVQPGWSRFNPSIVRHGGTTTIGVRSANYHLTDTGHYEMNDTAIRSQTVLIDLVDNHAISPRPRLIESHDKSARGNLSTTECQGVWWFIARVRVKRCDFRQLSVARAMREATV